MPRLSLRLHLVRQVAAAALLAVALVLALRPPPAPAAEPEARTAPVVVAATDLPAGTRLTEADLTVARLPPDQLPTGSATDPAELAGRVLAGAVRAAAPITDVRLVGAGLTALLPSGQVAAPVRLADLAVAALVRTGDRVDVLATPDDATSAVTVAEGALVLAAAEAGVLPVDDPSAGLLLVAVDDTTAALLASAATTSTLTVTLPPP